MRRLAYALRAHHRNLFANPVKNRTELGERTVQRDHGPSVPVMSRDMLDTSRVQPADVARQTAPSLRSEEHTSELQSRLHLVCRLLLEKKKKDTTKKLL